MKDKINIILNTFRELQNQELIKDKESEQIQKISNMLEKLQRKEKYKDDIAEFDNLFDEIINLRYVISEKYIKIGVALGGNND